jgi:hypothetical protein
VHDRRLVFRLSYLQNFEGAGVMVKEVEIKIDHADAEQHKSPLHYLVGALTSIAIEEMAATVAQNLPLNLIELETTVHIDDGAPCKIALRIEFLAHN